MPINTKNIPSDSLLIMEIKRLQDRILELERELSAKDKSGSNAQELANRKPRKPLQTEIEFIGDFDLVKAEGVNYSESGMCFEVLEPLPFEMRFEIDKIWHQRRAWLAWTKVLPSGAQRFGFHFFENVKDSEI